MFYRAKVAGLVFCAVFTGQIHAQQGQQTVESAQRFLEQMLPAVRINPNDWKFEERKADLNRFGKIDEVRTVGRCRSAIKVSYDQYSARVYNRSGKLVTADWGRWSGTENLAFDKWTEVKAPPTRKQEIVVYTTNSEPINLRVDSESLRDRLAFALDFLRQHCDAAVSTGF